MNLSSLWHLIHLSLILWSLALPPICTRTVGSANGLNRTKWSCNQRNLRPCSAVRGRFVKTISRVINNNDSRLERMPVPLQPCDHWGMERQRSRKAGQFPEIIHRHVYYHNIHPRLYCLFILCLCKQWKILSKQVENQTMKATYHLTHEVHVLPKTGLCIAPMATKVKANAGCKFNHDITTSSMTL